MTASGLLSQAKKVLVNKYTHKQAHTHPATHTQLHTQICPHTQCAVVLGTFIVKIWRDSAERFGKQWQCLPLSHSVSLSLSLSRSRVNQGSYNRNNKKNSAKLARAKMDSTLAFTHKLTHSQTHTSL